MIKGIFKNRCNLWFCFKKQWRCIQISIGNDEKNIVSKIATCYCERHARIADEMFKNNEIKLDMMIEKYEGL